MEKRQKKPSKPLGFSKTVGTKFLAPVPVSEHRRKGVRAAQAGRPGARLFRPDADNGAADSAPAFAFRAATGRPAGSQRMARLVREWLAEVKVMGRSEQTIKWYQQKMDWYLEHEGGPATLDGLTSAEVKRLLGVLIDRGLAPNTVHGFSRSCAPSPIGPCARALLWIRR